MANDDETRAVTVEIEVSAPPELVWKALTRPEYIARWFPPISGGSGEKVGDQLLISWGDAMQWTTNVTAVEQGKHIRWLDDPSNPAIAVDWYLETRGGKTVVRLVNSGFSASSDWDDQFTAITTGWTYFLFNLREVLERHPNTARVLVSERRKSTAPRDDVWKRLSADVAPAAAALRIGDETFDAVIEQRIPGRAIWGRIPSLADALLFVEFEPGREHFHTGMWLSTYGLPEARVDQLRTGLRATADRIFTAPEVT